MRLIELISEQRRRHIVGHAEPHLEEGEEILHWVRARKHGATGEGFAYLTPRRLLVVLTGRQDGSLSLRWEEMTAWGVDIDAPSGPLLAFAGAAEPIYVHMPVLTPATAALVGEFIAEVAARAPEPVRAIDDADRDFHPRADRPIKVQPRTLGARAKKIAITIVGLVLVLGGILLTPVPGPWSFPVVLGGLALLASEYDFAKDLKEWSSDKWRKTKKRLARGPS